MIGCGVNIFPLQAMLGKYVDTHLAQDYVRDIRMRCKVVSARTTWEVCFFFEIVETV